MARWDFVYRQARQHELRACPDAAAAINASSGKRGRKGDTEVAAPLLTIDPRSTDEMHRFVCDKQWCADGTTPSRSWLGNISKPQVRRALTTAASLAPDPLAS